MEDKIEKIIENMSLDELVGQVLCYSVPMKNDEDLAKFDEIFKRTMPGGIFVDNVTGEQIKAATELANKYTAIPIIVSADTEHGPDPIKDCTNSLPTPMAWGACDDEALIEQGGKATAQLCRKNGIHWSFAPVVDINYNKDNPVINTRAVSDSPKQVAKIAGAYLKGLQSEGLMAGGCKHFPGDGMDDRNQHFCTSVNPLSKEEWMETYGYVYKELFKLNPATVMVGHISAPAFQTECDDLGVCYPATLSKSLMTDLLRNELGFNGCIVSDALSMIGISAVVPESEMPVKFINAGGDMLLFAEPSYFDYIKNAVFDGTILMDRLKDAVRKILKLKQRVGLLDGKEPDIKITEDIEKIATKIAEKSIKIVRNVDNVLPVEAKEGDCILLCSLFYKQANEDKFETIEKELNKRGIKTVNLKKPSHKQIADALEKEKPVCVIVNSCVSQLDSIGSSLRLGWDEVFAFWRGYIFRHPKVIFTSFADPYKLYELPFLRTYVNTFSYTEESQKAFVKILLGEIEAKGKNPVELEGFFEREV